MAENLEAKAMKAVLNIDKNAAETRKDVGKIRETLWDIGKKLCHVIERKFKYYTLPDGIDYYNNNGSEI